jgi:hypothetical protein
VLPGTDCVEQRATFGAPTEHSHPPDWIAQFTPPPPDVPDDEPDVPDDEPDVPDVPLEPPDVPPSPVVVVEPVEQPSADSAVERARRSRAFRTGIDTPDGPTLQMTQNDTVGRG